MKSFNWLRRLRTPLTVRADITEHYGCMCSSSHQLCKITVEFPSSSKGSANVNHCSVVIIAIYILQSLPSDISYTASISLLLKTLHPIHSSPISPVRCSVQGSIRKAASDTRETLGITFLRADAQSGKLPPLEHEHKKQLSLHLCEQKKSR